MFNVFLNKFANAKQPQTWYDNSLNGIKYYEGFKNAPYKDSKGILTNGYGFNIQEPYMQNTAKKLGINLNGNITQQQADQLLRHSIDTVHLPSLRRMYKNYDKFPDGVKSSLLDMHYNLGGTKLKKFVNMNKSLAKGDWESAARHAYYSKWREDVKDRRAAPIINQMAGKDIYSGLKGVAPITKPTNNTKPAVTQIPQTQSRYHIIQNGDTFDALAKRYGTTTKAIMQKNPNVDPRKLQINQKIKY